MNPKTSQIQIRVGQLLRDAFAYTIPIYVPVLVFLLPSFVISTLMLGMTPGAKVLLFVINYFGILPFVTGAAIFYVHQNLTRRGATIPDSLQASGERFTQLVLLTFMSLVAIISGGLLLIIPGIYISIRVSFAYYALMIEGCSAFDAISRSWHLTQGHWWKLFWAFLALALAISIPMFVFLLIYAIADPAGLDLAGEAAIFLLGPFIYVYYVFLFMSFVNLAAEDAAESSF
jgi:membrane-anchored glycerophosphoryl diester phosphodiesterase (GDPDase)